MRTHTENSKARRFLGRPIAAATIIGLAAAMVVGVGVSSASAATFTNASVAVSNSQTSATNVTYTAQMTTATAGIIREVKLTLPPMTGTVGLGTVYGLGAGTVTAGGGSNTFLSYTLTTPQNVAAGVPLYVEFTGMTNPTTAQSSAPTIQTFDNATTPALIDAATTAPISFGGTNTAVTVQVAKSLTFTNDTANYTLLMDPSLPALSDLSKNVTLGVKTNAGQGYSLSVKDTGMKTAGTGASLYTIPGSAAAGLSSGAFAPNTFGYSATVTSAGNSLVALAPAGLATAGNLIGFTTAGATLINATKPTGNTADTVVLTNRVKIDYTTPAGTYTDTITYTATPAY